jgi:hypothetical protein
MAISAIPAAAAQSSAQQVLQASGHHKHRGESASSMSDVDEQSSSVSPAGGASARPGSLLNITA